MFGKLSNQLRLGISLGVVGVILMATPTLAALKDSDADGVTDQAETETYFTDPLNPDTDNDNVPDSDEILHRSDPLSKESSPLQTIEQSFPEASLPPWLLTWLATVATLVMASLVGLFISALIRKKKGAKPLLPTSPV